MANGSVPGDENRASARVVTAAEAPPAATPAPPRRKSGLFPRVGHLPRVVWLLGLASLFNDVSSEAIFPLLPVFLTCLGAPMRYLGLIEGSADALSSVLKMIAGRLSDRGPRRRLVTGGYALPAIARAGIALAAAPWHVLAARLIDRAGKGIRSGPRDAMLADSVAPVRARPRVRAQPLDGSPRARPWGRYRQRADGAGRRAARDVRRRGPASGLMAPVVLFLRLRDARQAGAAGRAVAGGQRSRRGPGFHVYLAVCVLFALGNSSDAFLLVRARELGWTRGRAAAAVVLPPPGEVGGGAAGRRAVRPSLARGRRVGGLGAYALTYSASASRRRAGRSWSCSSPTRSITAWPRAPSARSSPTSPSAAGAGARSASTTASSAWRRCPRGSATGLIWDRWGAAGRCGSTPLARRWPRRCCSGSRSPARCGARRRSERPVAGSGRQVVQQRLHDPAPLGDVAGHRVPATEDPDHSQ